MHGLLTAKSNAGCDTFSDDIFSDDIFSDDIFSDDIDHGKKREREASSMPAPAPQIEAHEPKRAKRTGSSCSMTQQQDDADLI